MAYIINMDRNDYPSPRTFKCEEADGLQRGLLLEIVGLAENGVWLEAGIDDNECYKVQLASAATAKENLMIHTSVPFQYDERLTERDFILKEGEIGRGHLIKSGDEYTLPADMIIAAVAVGDEVGLGVNGKLDHGAAEAIGVVTKVYTWNGQESMRIRFY